MCCSVHISITWNIFRDFSKKHNSDDNPIDSNSLTENNTRMRVNAYLIRFLLLILGDLMALPMREEPVVKIPLALEGIVTKQLPRRRK